MLRSLEEVLAAARQAEACTIAVAAAQDQDVLTAVYAAVREGIVKPVLVGDREEILKIAQEASIPVKPEEIVDEPDKAAACTEGSGAGTGRPGGSADEGIRGYLTDHEGSPEP